MSKLKTERLLTFKNVTIFGLVFCVAITAYIFAVGKYPNFTIFQLATFDFWNGISPYSDHWFRHGYDYYLYSPIFNVLFTPFAYLPQPIGLFAWNAFNYLLLAYSIRLFPNISDKQKAYTLLFILPILAPALMSCQYNIAVAAMFVLGFVLMEKDKPLLAITVMIISGMTKIYGLAELAILVFYPRLWRNVGYVLLLGAVCAILPLIEYSLTQYGALITEWFGVFAKHKSSRDWDTLFDISIIPWGGMRYVLMPYIQVGVFALLSIFVLIKKKLWDRFEFRIGIVALIVGWCILFGNSSETHTYLISVVGFLLWYHTICRHSTPLKILYWSVFAIIAVVPIDLIFPAPAWHFIYRTLDLNKWLMLVLWVYMIFLIFSDKDHQTMRSKNE